MKEEKGIYWFEEVDKCDIPLVGGKGAQLGEMTRAGFPVPPGYIVSVPAYFDFLKKSHLTPKIQSLLKDLDTTNTKQLEEVSAAIKQLIHEAPMPGYLTKEIQESYKKSGEGFVAVRSSATAEDLPTASFAGQHCTLLNVKGKDELPGAIKECWASLYEPNAILSREEMGFGQTKVGMATPIQRMVESESAGVMMTVDPVTEDFDTIYIEAVFGLGEPFVSHELRPDIYKVDKNTLAIKSKKIVAQPWQLIKNKKGGGELNVKVPIPVTKQKAQKLSDSEIQGLADMGVRLELHYGYPQDVEFAKEKGTMYIVQSRPITTLKLE